MSERRPDILFVHSNFPGQFGFVADGLMQRGHRCAAIATTGQGMPGVSMARWKLNRGTTAGIHSYAVRAEADLMRGEAAARAALALKQNGFDPALIIGHPGWGETIFLREIFPQARQILYGEYYYQFKGGDAGFDPEFPVKDELEDTLRIHAKNASQLLAYADADAIVSPTPFQASRFPQLLHDRITIIHEGVNTQAIQPDAEARVTLPNGEVLDRSRPVVTMINRRFEPLRGYHVFMRALPAIMKACPDAQVLVIGADQPGGYGLNAPKGTTWGKVFLDEVKDRLDLSRLHFMGTLPHKEMLAVLSISSAHIYYTYPFVLSWSLLEAMACGCAIIASKTPPVEDVLVDGRNARLLPFFDVEALSQAVTEALTQPEHFAPLRRQARADVMNAYDRGTHCLPEWLKLVDRLLAG